MINGDSKIEQMEWEMLNKYADERVIKNLQKKGKFPQQTDLKYVIYARKSTKGRKTNNKGKKVERQERSIPDQIKDCQNLAADLNVKVLQIFQESESAKKSGKRDEYMQMILDIKKKKYNAIICWHPDRLARNMKEGGEIIDLLDKGILADLKFKQYTFVNDTNGIMTLGIQFVLAKQYSDNLSAVSQRGSGNIAHEGKSPTNRPKYGYKIVKRFFRPDGNNFHFLKESFEMAIQKYSLEEIADYLNRMNFTYENKICKITKQKLSDILADPFYAGLYVYGKEKIVMNQADFEFKSLISPSQFLKVRKLLGDDRRTKLTNQKKEVLLRGVVVCGHCKSVMNAGVVRGGSSGRYSHLRCNTKDCSYKIMNNKAHDIRGKIVTQFVIDQFSSGFEIDEKAYTAYLKEVNEDAVKYKNSLLNKPQAISKKISEIESELTNKEETISIVKDRRMITKLNDELSNLLDEKEQLESDLINIKKELSQADISAKSSKITYKQFLNYFENLGNTVKTTDNIYLANKIIQLVFLNFVIRDKKVTEYRLNPEFAKYVKFNSVLSGRGGRT